MKALLWRAYRRLLLLLAVIIVTIAVILSILRAFSPLISSERINIEAYLSKELQQPVTIGSIKMAWRGIEPVMRIHNIIFLDPKTRQPTAIIHTLDLGINLGHSLLSWQLKPGLVAVSGLSLKVIQDKDGTFQIPGIHAIPPFKLLDGGDNRHQKMLQRIFNIGHIYLNNININLQLSNGNKVRMRDLQMELLNGNTEHRLWGSVTLAQAPPTVLDFVAYINGNLAEEDKKVNARLYVKAHDLSLPQFLSQFNLYHLNATHGLTGFQLWLNWRDRQIESLQTKFQVHNLTLIQSMNPKPFQINSLTANVDWRRTQQGGWKLTADGRQIVGKNKNWQPIQVYIQNPAATEKHKNQIVYISYLDLREFTPLIQYWSGLPDTVRKPLQQMQPEGEIFDFYLKRQPLAIKSLPGRILNNYSITAQFYNLGLQHWDHVPTLKGLSGQVVVTPHGGKLILDSQHMQVFFPGVFINPQYFSEFQTTIHWVRKANGWHVHAVPFYAANKDLTLHGTMKAFIPTKTKIPEINLLFKLENLKLAHLHEYLPQAIMKSSLKEWLQKSVLGGVADQATILLRGRLDQFPYEHHKGVFIVKANFHDLNLLYNPKWPVAKNLAGTLTFSGNQLKGVIQHGELANTTITHATVEIPYLGDERPEFVIISSQQQGDLASAMQFLRTGPLREHIGKTVSDMQLQGPMSLNLNLSIPLKKEDKNVKAEGFLTIKNATQTVPSWGIRLTGLTGQLFFSEHELFARNMKAMLFGQPLSFDISTLTKHGLPTSTQINVQGKLNFQSVLRHLHLPEQPFIKGTTNYQAVLLLNHDSKISDSLLLTSDVKGLAINLPPPFTKKANEALDFKINLAFNHQQPLHVIANYGDRMSTALVITRQNHRLQLLNGEVLFGSSKANFPQHPGLLITGKLTEFNWSKWSSVFDYIKRIGSHNAITTSMQPRVNVFIDRLSLWQQEFRATRVRIFPNPHGWEIIVAGPCIAGRIWWNRDLHGNSILARLDYLYLSAKALSSEPSSINPRLIPALDITIDDLGYDDIALGELDLLTAPVKDGLMIKLLSLDNPHLHFEVSGDWLTELGGGSRTSVSGGLLSHDLGALLTSWHLPTVVIGKDLKINLLLSWPDTPFNFRLGLLEGVINLQMGEGSITNVGKKAQESIKLGRLLNLLSLEKLPKRLLLHFEDLTAKGFTFDSIKGDFAIHDGDAETENTIVKGLVADIAMKGQIGLAQKDFNLRLAVTPHLTSSLPVLVALTGGPAGPIAGAITWAVLKVLSPLIGELTTRYYDVTGPWHKPSVTSVDKAKKDIPRVRKSQVLNLDRMEDFISAENSDEGEKLRFGSNLKG